VNRLLKKYWLYLFLIMSAFIYANKSDKILTLKIEKKEIKTEISEKFDIKLLVKIKDHWHINSNEPNDEFLIPATVEINNDSFKIENKIFPEAKEFSLPYSDKPAIVYEGEFEIIVSLKATKNLKPGKYKIPVTFGYQACNDKTCLRPANIEDTITVNLYEANNKLTGKIEQINKEEPKKEIKKTSQISEKETVIDGKNKPVTQKQKNTTDNESLFFILIFAFIGGMILNLMPCVLPVLSLKIMGIVQQAGEDPKEKLKHGILFTIGVLVSFWALAGLLLILRAGGEQLGWGFQLQSPGFVIILVVLLFMFALSMFGLFEIGASLTAVGQNTQNKSAYMGSFMSGILATVVATPCTAPFMGSALGYAISQPPIISLLVFTFLGLGMAAPYLVLTNSPKLLKFVPKPGAWMETMKQVMGFLLVATVLWLLWVLSLQTGAEGLIIVLASLVITSIGGWIYGRWGNISKRKRTRVISQFLFVIILVFGTAFSLYNVETKSENADGVHKQGSISWQKFSPELVSQLRKENKPVLIDFTAAWCLSCQVNEKVAFGDAEVQRVLKEKNVETLKADWTNNDEVITKALAEFGRNSVPLYVLYLPGKEAELLPEIITPGIVLQALEKIK